jgi:phosphatidylglycerol:prolipoprotein diacylglycerol transferase
LPTYGVLLALALGAALYAAIRLGRREGFEPARLFDLSTWTIIAALVGAKALMILTDWQYYQSNPGELLSWGMIKAGGVFYGGFVAAWAFSVWYVQRYRLPVWKVFDVCAPAVALGQSIGRVGCFMAGDDYGKVTKFPLHVVFADPRAHDIGGVPLGVPLHPVQLYESLATLALFLFLLRKYRRKAYDGQIFVLYLALYAVARFFLEFLRGDEDRGFVFNHLLSTSQLIAILMVVAAAFVFYRRGRTRELVGSAAAWPATKRARG